MVRKKQILFLCTGNSCRSQMAEGWLNHLRGDQFSAHSAGIECHGLNPYAIEIMAEVGVDISSHKSQHVDELLQTFDMVITVCDNAHESCPVFLGQTRLIHVGFEDPPKLARGIREKDQILDCYRKVRDQIKEYILAPKFPDANF